MLKRILNGNGLGLTQVLVASALLMGVSIAVINHIENETKKLNRKSKDLVVADFHKEIIDNFSSPSSCLNSVVNGSAPSLSSFSGNEKLNISSIKNQDNVEVYAANPTTGSILEGVRYEGAHIRNYDPTLKTASLVNVFTYSLGPNSKITKYKQTILSITPDITGTKLETCALSGKDAGSGDTTSPDVKINQATTQVDPALPPTAGTPVLFDIEFNEIISASSFTSSDITFIGTAVVSAWEIVNSGGDSNFLLKVTGTTATGTIVPSIAAGTVQDLSGNDNNSSTSTDNSVLVQIPANLIWLNPASVENFGTITTDQTININLKNTGEVTSKVIQLTTPTGNWSLGPTNSCQGNTLAKNQECGSLVCDNKITYTLKNTGTTLSNNITVTTTNPTQFEVLENTCTNSTLASNATCTMKVNFKASGLAAGSYSSVLSGRSFNSTVNTVNLTGTKVSTDPCAGTPAVGAKCMGCSMIYAGTYNNQKYYTTPGGCTDSTTPSCAGGSDTVYKIYGTNNITTGYTSTTNGISNTSGLATNYSDAYAAKFCQDMVLDGYTDWYLPAKDELYNTLYVNRASIEGLNNGYYASSSESSLSDAFLAWNFTNGALATYLKSSPTAIRCVRKPDCFGTTAPDIGTICSDGSIYAGTLNGIRYFTTKGGCSNSPDHTSQFSPTCSGGNDIMLQPFNNGTSSYDFPEIPNVTCPISTLSGEFSTSIAADYPSIIHKSPRYCRNMVYAGRPDWFMPGIQERMMLWNNKAMIQGMTTGPTDYHTTSEETNANLVAMTVWCGSGANYQSKSYTRAIRCLRKWNPSDPCHGDNPTIGANCSGGAKYAGALTVDGVTSRYMVTPGGCPFNADDSIQFTPTCLGSNDSFEKSWGPNYDHLSLSANTPDPKSGEYNTNIESDYTTVHPAARYCQNMMYGGYSDWFLPNREELLLLYSNRASLGGFVTTIGAYSNGAYWSSTKSSVSSDAVSVSFGSGITSSSPKNTPLFIRCVRRY